VLRLTLLTDGIDYSVADGLLAIEKLFPFGLVIVP